MQGGSIAVLHIYFTYKSQTVRTKLQLLSVLLLLYFSLLKAG